MTAFGFFAGEQVDYYREDIKRLARENEFYKQFECSESRKTDVNEGIWKFENPLYNP